MDNKKTNPAVYIFLLLLFLTLIPSISFAWMITDTLSLSPQQGLDVGFVDDTGVKITDPVLNEGNAYPGWSKTSPVKIKNFGAKSRYMLGLDFSDDQINRKPCLADVLSLKVIRNGIETDYRLIEFINKPLIDSTQINKGAVEDITFILSMDECAGNEYQCLSLDLKLTLYAEPIEYSHEPEHYNGGNNGGTTVIAEPSPEPTLEDIVESVDEIIEEPLPDRGGDHETEIIIDDEIPKGSVLPNTGGIPIEIPVGFGVVLILTGCHLKLKK